MYAFKIAKIVNSLYDRGYHSPPEGRVVHDQLAPYRSGIFLLLISHETFSDALADDSI